MAHYTPKLRLLAMAGFCSLASMRICDAMLPALVEAFSVSNTEAALVISSFTMMYCLMLLVCGALGDRYGRLRVVTVAVGLCTLASLGASLAPSLYWLAVARAGMGASAAGIVAVGIAWIGDTVAMEKRQAVLAQYMGIIVGGTMIGAWIGGLLTESVGWRGAFVVLALLFGTICLLSLRRFDLAVPVRLSKPLPYSRQLAGLLATRWSRLIFGAAFLEGVFAFGTLPFVPSLMHQKFGLSLTQSGAVLALFGLGGLIFSQISGPLMRRVDTPGLARLGGVSLGLGFALIAWMPNWPITTVGCFFAGLGYYCLHNTIQVEATQLSITARGLSVALFGFCFFLGQSLGVLITASVLGQVDSAWCHAIAAAGLVVLGFVYAARLESHMQLEPAV